MTGPRLRDYLLLAAAPVGAAALVMLLVVGVGWAVTTWAQPTDLGEVSTIGDTLKWLLQAGVIAAVSLAAIVALIVAWRLVPRADTQVTTAADGTDGTDAAEATDATDGARASADRSPMDYAKLAVLPIGVLVAAGLLFGLLSKLEVLTTEISLIVLLAAGVVALVLGLAVVAVFMAWHKLADARAPLGLPEGSVRAVIALSLILIFAILSIFVFRQTNPTTGMSFGITSEQIELLDEARITRISRAMFRGRMPTGASRPKRSSMSSCQMLRAKPASTWRTSS